ncbi:MAG: hypothetical protein ACI4JF_00430 [Oscillospiraceae bacterium]
MTFEAGSFEAKTSFIVNTGAKFENSGLDGMYANYKVELTAELLDESGAAVENTSCSDYIIYTNAKICTNMMSVS